MSEHVMYMSNFSCGSISHTENFSNIVSLSIHGDLMASHHALLKARDVCVGICKQLNVSIDHQTIYNLII